MAETTKEQRATIRRNAAEHVHYTLPGRSVIGLLDDLAAAEAQRDEWKRRALTPASTSRDQREEFRKLVWVASHELNCWWCHSPGSGKTVPAEYVLENHGFNLHQLANALAETLNSLKAAEEERDHLRRTLDTQWRKTVAAADEILIQEMVDSGLKVSECFSKLEGDLDGLPHS